jgi:hypothetical protein
MSCVYFIFQECFGIVEDCADGGNTIVLAAPGFPPGTQEVFSTENIKACCSRCTLLDIKNYRYYCSQ